MIWSALPVVAISYLVGSIPTGLIVGRAVRGIDVRDYGSGKTGATNTLRTLGIGPSLVVFIGDILKGVFAVMLARYVTHVPWVEVIAALSAVIGHNWPVFAGFRGGRGVSASLGGALATVPWAALICLGVFITVVVITRYVSAGSILGTVAMPLVTLVLVLTNQAPVEYLFFTLIGGAMLVFLHRDNLVRLLAGTERKLGQKESLG